MNAHRHLVFLLGSAWCSFGISQTFLPASDVDLSASYCLGVVQRQVGGAAQFAAKLQNADARTVRAIGEHQRALQEKVRRLQAYIVPKIVYTDPMALTLARARGGEDYDSIMAFLPPEECHAEDQKRSIECGVARLQATPVWQRMDRCTRLEFLPF